MNQQEKILVQVQQIVCEILKRDNIVLTFDTTSHDVSGWDSLTHMLIVAEVEKCFNIRINFRELMKISDVGVLVQTIEKKIK